jgi:integrase
LLASTPPSQGYLGLLRSLPCHKNGGGLTLDGQKVEASAPGSVRNGYEMGNPDAKTLDEDQEAEDPQMLPVYFTRDQFGHLLSKIEDRDLRELVTMAALTGLRLGELLAMTWTWVDLSRKTITVQNSVTFTTKCKRARIVPLSEEAYEVLIARRERMQDGIQHVFTRRGRDMNSVRESKMFKKAVRESGLPDTLHFHSLRHTFASWLVQSGASLCQVSQLLGHSSTNVTEIHAHLVPNQMHGVISALKLEN